METRSLHPAVEAENLQKSFGDFRAVDGISFRVRRGECFGMLGPNGAGKTSTIRMLYGFSPRSGGRLRVLGLEVPGQLRAIKSRLGVCQQENSLDPDLTVEQNLHVFASYFNLPRSHTRARADDLLRFIALEHRSSSGIMELSGGMARRLMLARALINDPDLVILDEPTTGLDPQSRHQVWERLERLREQGLTILLTTHNMEEAERLCDRLVIIDRGRILVEGTPGSLIRQYAGGEVIEVPKPEEDLRRFVRNRNIDHEDLGYRMILYLRERDSLFGEIRKAFCREDCILRPATLEDVFLRLTGRELRE